MNTIKTAAAAAALVLTASGTALAQAAPPVAGDPNLDPQVRSFLEQINKDPSPFWELPQPRPQEILTGLQNLSLIHI